jgi:hypothetical protein
MEEPKIADTLADAILRGCALSHPNAGNYWSYDEKGELHTCALGAMYLGFDGPHIGLEWLSRYHIINHIGPIIDFNLMNVIVPWPEMIHYQHLDSFEERMVYDERGVNYVDMVNFLQSHGFMTRPQIAEWTRTLQPQFEQHLMKLRQRYEAALAAQGREVEIESKGRNTNGSTTASQLAS